MSRGDSLARRKHLEGGRSLDSYKTGVMGTAPSLWKRKPCKVQDAQEEKQVRNKSEAYTETRAQRESGLGWAGRSESWEEKIGEADRTCCLDRRECEEASGKAQLLHGEGLRSHTEVQTRMETASLGLSPLHTSRHPLRGPLRCPLRWALKERKGVWTRIHPKTRD